MKYILSILTVLVTSLTLSALPKGFYAPRSVLGEGNWVKVAVDESGVYEITYQTLRAMGFSNPEKVSVYGRGGKILPTEFVTQSGKPNLYDDLSPVAVLHRDNKLFFYALGVDSHTYRQAAALTPGGYFSRESKNIYTNKGYYFLTDTGTPVEMKTRTNGNNTVNGTTNTGYGMAYHELDLVQNNSNTGQLFFGEKLTGENARMEWPLSLPGCISGSPGVLECFFFLDRDVQGHLSYGINGSELFADFDTRTYPSTDFRQQEPYFTEVDMQGENSTVFVEFQSPDELKIAHLDYWTLTYPRYLPNLRDSKGNKINQEVIYFPDLPRNRTWAATFNNAGSMVILDVTDPTEPAVLDAPLKGSSKTVHITNYTDIPKIMVFDPLQTQKQISGYDTSCGFMSNQDLHARVADGADLLIIHIPSLREQAEKLAAIHEKYDGIKVVTASTEEVYNEFSQGIPDAMAYRSFVKAAYSTDHPVKNVLFLGPISADYRGVVTERNQQENIIAYQLTPMNQIRGAQNANDFYGMMDDRFQQSALEKNTMHVGVGILPCRFPAEAETIIDKIERFISRDDFAYYSNKFLNIGGIGDNHTHDLQARSIGSIISKVDYSSSILTPLIVDAYGHDSAHDKFFDVIEDGTLNILYFGHGGPSRLNRAGNFFTINDVYRLRNSFTPFMGFAGCEISGCDRGIRGLGEALVTATQYGLIGTLLATRETWSGQNFDLFQTFMINMFCDGSDTSSPLHKETLTIGEIFARAKTRSTYNNELAYQLLCDPAIKLPTVSRSLVLDENKYQATVGEYNTISGYVAKHGDNSAIDDTFCGEVVIRVMEPFQQLTSQDLCTGNYPETTQTIDLIYADTQVAMTTARVENGRFTAEIFIPEKMKEYGVKSSRIHSCAYDPSTRLVAASMYPMTFTDSELPSTQDRDTNPPVIDIMEYDEETNVIRVAVHDDVALSFSKLPLTESFTLKLDGRINPTAARHEATVADNGRYMEKDIPLSDLTEGSHSAMLTVADVAGNTASREIIFSYYNRPRYVIRLLEEAVRDIATFSIEGTMPQAADLIIMSAGGDIIYRAPFKSQKLVWNVTDANGNPLAPGLYKAYLLETGTRSDKSHSPIIDIPVI